MELALFLRRHLTPIQKILPIMSVIFLGIGALISLIYGQHNHLFNYIIKNQNPFTLPMISFFSILFLYLFSFSFASMIYSPFFLFVYVANFFIKNENVSIFLKNNRCMTFLILGNILCLIIGSIIALNFNSVSLSKKHLIFWLLISSLLINIGLFSEANPKTNKIFRQSIIFFAPILSLAINISNIYPVSENIMQCLSFATDENDIIFMESETYKTVNDYLEKAGSKKHACFSSLNGKTGYFLNNPYVSWNDGGDIILMSTEIKNEIITFPISKEKIKIIINGNVFINKKGDCIKN